MAGGEWEDIEVEGESLGYGCMIGRSTQREVKLFTDGSFGVQVEYAVLGIKEGAEYLSVDYWVDISREVPNEPKHRADYIEFIKDLTKASLNADLPANIQKRIRDLKTYAPAGKNIDEHTEKVGKGRIVLKRNKGPEGGSIMATVKIYPSQSAK